MGKRNITIKARMDEDEYECFLNLLKQSKLASSSEYIRQATLSGQIKPPPPPELVEVLKALLRENQAQGNNLNQIAFVANASGYPIPKELKDMQEENKSLGAEMGCANGNDNAYNTRHLVAS